MSSHHTLTRILSMNSGTTIPMFGLGVYEMTDEEAERAVLAALELGYRHIDTAALYKNEAAVGRAIVKSGIPREEIFITTKIWVTDFLSPERALERSLQLLGMSYVDLYLVHWPAPGRGHVWKKLERAFAEGKCKAIGVSNYSVAQLKELQSNAKVQPGVNQIEVSPFLYRKDVIDYCAEQKIVVEAYSPLTRGKRLNDPTVVDVARRMSKTSAQVLLQWCIQHNLVVIPKSANPVRIKENAELDGMTISAEDMDRLDGLHESYSSLFPMKRK